MTVAVPPPRKRRPPATVDWFREDGLADMAVLVAAPQLREPDPHGIYRRVHMALASVRATWRGQACLTHYGAEYLGVPYEPVSRPSQRELEEVYPGS